MNELLEAGVLNPFLAGMLVGFGLSILTILGVFWIDKILDYRWRKKYK